MSDDGANRAQEHGVPVPNGAAEGAFVGVVEWMRDLAREIKNLRIALVEPDRIAFRPGQTIRLRVPVEAGGKEVYRNYSIANPPDDEGAVELIIRRAPGGLSTTWIFERLRVGEQVRFLGPFGRFGLSESSLPMIWVAGGSGVSPLWSMLRHMRNRGIRRPCTFFFGAATVADMPLRKELRQMERELDWFRFAPTVERLDDGQEWDGDIGLVTEVVERQVQGGQPVEAYLCGPPGLIEAAVLVLTGKGVPPDHIHVDKFLSQRSL
jgi:NAD(P)H-flavin reductase